MFPNDWNEILKGEAEKDYFKKIMSFLDEQYAQKDIYPPRDEIFTSMKLTPFNDVKAVILGQDPYHEPGQAHGLAFSVKPGVPPPPSLKNMFKELQADLGCFIPDNGYLEKWARQGVMLLNTSLSVERGLANSHSKIGWSIFTDEVIKALNRREKPVIFILWGSNARAKLEYITSPQHFVLEAAHPSPLSAMRGFMGCRHFSKVNTILERLGETPIDWQIENLNK